MNEIHTCVRCQRTHGERQTMCSPCRLSAALNPSTKNKCEDAHTGLVFDTIDDFMKYCNNRRNKQ